MGSGETFITVRAYLQPQEAPSCVSVWSRGCLGRRVVGHGQGKLVHLRQDWQNFDGFEKVLFFGHSSSVS